ncbi:MAG: response regulator transcription factor [Clostridiales bacterium]|nr:response regulator transcription factor [Clostridiales bacterium]
MARRVLVVDDEKLIVKGLKFSLEQDGMEVECAYDGEEALNKVKDSEFDMVILDVMLPRLSGLEVCQHIREFSDVPVIMLTAKGDDIDKIMGLEFGADDYMTKPFNILELKARMKAITRRTDNMRKQEKKDSVIEIGGLKMDTDARRVFFNDREINLTVKEFDVLVLLITHPNKVYSRDKLLSLIWGDSYIGEARTVDVHVSRLRDKLSMVSGKQFIHTKWGVGYYFEA